MPKLLELWFVRHGETTANAAHKMSGWSDVELTPKGEAQARAAGEILKGVNFDRVWSSDLKRAVKTARLAYGEPSQDPQLREMNFGDMENCHIDDIGAEHKKALLNFVDFKAPGGEHQEEFRNRVLDFANKLSEGRHLIFTHGGVIRMFTQDLGEDRFIKNGGIVIINWTQRSIISVKNVP